MFTDIKITIYLLDYLNTSLILLYNYTFFILNIQINFCKLVWTQSLRVNS